LQRVHGVGDDGNIVIRVEDLTSEISPGFQPSFSNSCPIAHHTSTM
jgi:hypothetical protein